MRHEISDLSHLEVHGWNLSGCVLQSVDLSGVDISYWKVADVSGAYFLGCVFDSLESEDLVRKRGGVVFPRIGGLRYNPYRNTLYTAEELYGPSDSPEVSLDQTIYQDYIANGKTARDIVEALARRIHDHAIDDALDEYLHGGRQEKRLVGIMGGASRSRTDPWYAQVARTAFLLTKAGYTVVTGGGPGMMEAGNLGAWLADGDERNLADALQLLAHAPDEHHPEYLRTAFEVKRRFAPGGDSLGVPTWFYGHEATNVFAAHIAKYFANSIREDGLLQIAKSGVVFSPGAAGTRQEIFQDAAQNHYVTFDYVSPMAFLGVEHFNKESPCYPLLCQVANDRYRDMLFLTDEPEAIVDWIRAHPPVKGA